MRELPMTPGEIVTSYKQAANPKEQIKILAELNAATTEEIREVLNDCGIAVQPLGAVARWSAAEETLLRDLLEEGKTAEQIAKLLGRTVKSIRQKAFKMKLSLHNSQQPAGTLSPMIDAVAAVDDKLRAEVEAEIEAYEARRLKGEKVLTRDNLIDLIYRATGEELMAGQEARLVDMLQALGYSVVKHFADGDGYERERTDHDPE